MITSLGFHTDRDLHTELAALQSDIRITTARCANNTWSTPETGWNTWGHLDNLRFRYRVLAKEAAMEDQRINRLTHAVQQVGDPQLGFIAYVIFGPNALPVEPLYEIRLIDSYGYTVATDSLRTNIPARRLESARRDLLHVVAPRYARDMGMDVRDLRVQVTAF